ncbi:hypothetical protein AB4Z54_53970, partial [Streptomyces sp. MCAF7]
RAQFAVHAPPIEAEVDAERLAQALAHLIADVAGGRSSPCTRRRSRPRWTRSGWRRRWRT